MRAIRSVLAAAVLGPLAIVAPAFFYPEELHESVAFLPLVFRAVEGMQPLAVFPLLFLAGFLASRVGPIHPALIGLSSVVPLCAWSVLDVILGDPHVERHNLLPIEWSFYVVFAVIASLGALADRRRRAVNAGSAALR